MSGTAGAFGLLRRTVRNWAPVDSRALLRATLVKRLMPQRPVVGWLLCGDRATGSSRIHGFNLSGALNDLGVASYIVRTSSRYTERFDLDEAAQQHLTQARLDTVVFQRVHIGAAPFVRRLQAEGTRCVFVMADLYECELLPVVDHVVVVSQALRDWVVDRGVGANRVTVIPDAVETPPSLCKDYGAQPTSSRLRLVWVGNEGHWHTLDPLRRLLATPAMADMDLVTISSHPEANRRWSLDTFALDALDCDIAVVPAEADIAAGRVKSNNRVTMFRALGLPVVCTPLPAYRDVARLVGGIRFAVDDGEWADALAALRDPAVRRADGQAGRAQVFEHYGLSAVAARFRGVLLPHYTPSGRAASG